MYNQKILWLGFLAIIGTLAATPTNAEPTHDPGGYSATEIFTPPIGGTTTTTQFNPTDGTISGGIINNPIEITSGSGSGAGSGSSAGLGSSAGGGSGLGTPSIGNSDSGSGSGSGSGAGENGESIVTGENAEGTVTAENGEGRDNNVSLGKGECATIACLAAEDSPQQLSLNDAAKLLEDSLSTSTDNLAAAEEKFRIASNTRRNTLETDVRRITRNANSCPNPDSLTATKDDSLLEAREVLEKQLTQSQEFIEQVNLIDPETNIW